MERNRVRFPECDWDKHQQWRARKNVLLTSQVEAGIKAGTLSLQLRSYSTLASETPFISHQHNLSHLTLAYVKVTPIMHATAFTIAFMALISSCMAQNVTSATAPSPTASAGTFSIIKPFTNTQIQAGTNVDVTWAYTGYADSTQVVLQLEDIRTGPTTGKPFAQLGSFAISAKLASVAIPANAPAGQFAISALLGGNAALYFSSPPFLITAGSGVVSSAASSSAVSTAASSGASSAAKTTGVVTGSPTPSPSNNANNTAASKPSAATRGSSAPVWYNFIPAIVCAFLLL
ncbi:hypothetical protein HDU97_001903 [Phlyctochytrium planicorne]|nr:hypothetical protein HDU97_001903 [Phlyctochytrium planicorne]